MYLCNASKHIFNYRQNVKMKKKHCGYNLWEHTSAIWKLCHSQHRITDFVFLWWHKIFNPFQVEIYF